MAERQLIVRIIGDDKDLQRAFKSSEKSATRFQGRVEGIGRGLSSTFAAVGISLGTAAVFRGIEKSVAAASDLNEQISKSRQVFGASSKSVEEWSQTTAQKLGIARAEALTATGMFGNLLNTVGLLPAQSAEMSQALVQLAADLASFNNADPSDVLNAIRSGLIGEAEPLRRFGVLLSETRVQQEALAATGKTNVKSLTDQEKALARYNIILRDTAPAQGDFERTQGGLANQSRILRANLNDLSADVGGVLIPALTDLTRTANLAAAALERVGAVEIPGGPQIKSLFGWISGWNELNFLLDQIDPKLQRIAQVDLPQQRRGGRGGFRPSGAALAEDDAKQQARDLERTRKRFAVLMKGLGLKLDKAGLTRSLDDDLAVLQEIERAIQRQIGREGKTFELVQQLTDVRRQILDTAARRAESQAERTRQATDRIVAARKDEQDKLRELTEQRRERRRGRQFEALGLTAEGAERVPGRGALRRRLGSLQDQIKGTFLDTAKTRSQLRNISKVLRGEFGAVGRDVRAAIQQMLKDFASALQERTGGAQGPLTRFSKQGVENLVAGLGLTAQQIKEIRQRFSRRGRGGTVPGVGVGAFGIPQPLGAGGVPIIQNEISVFLDGEKITSAVTRRQQKRRGRRGASRRGVRPGGHF